MSLHSWIKIKLGTSMPLLFPSQLTDTVPKRRERKSQYFLFSALGVLKDLKLSTSSGCEWPRDRLQRKFRRELEISDPRPEAQNIVYHT